MRRIPPLALSAALLCSLTVTACSEGAKAERLPPVASTAGAVEPWDTLAPDSIYGASPADNLRLLPVDLDLVGLPASWEGMRIAAVSDLDIGLWRDNARVAAAAIERAVAARPDLIVLLGDFVTGEREIPALATALAPLRGHPTLAVLGDRDAATDSLAAAVTEALHAVGARVLSNGSVPWAFHGDTALVSGVDPELISQPEADRDWILSQLGGGARRGLLLTHQPQVAAFAPEGRFPGILAGNTFCGRVEVPGSPRLSWLTATALPGAAVKGMPRFFRFGTSVMFVTCGTGYGFVPVRFGAPPEVALVTLHPVLPPGAARAADSATARADSMSMDTLLRRYQGADTTAAAADSAR
jgi:predicted MPP superfamily phosphohydrolase